MAFNLQTFKTRTLTAIVYAAVMLAGLLWNHWSFLILFSIIHFGCWWEYLNLVEKIYSIKLNSSIKGMFMLIGYILFFNIGIWWLRFDFFISPFGINLSLKWILYGGLVLLLIIYLFQNHFILLKAKLISLFGFIYISLGLGLMLNMNRNSDIHLHDTMYVINATFLPLIIIVSIWINDTMAYLVGSFIGKTPLSKISPKKTWEGTIGGIILCVLVMFLFWTKLVYSISDNTFNILVGIIAAISAIAGTFGDLYESKLKRMAGVKDSGSFMPGHGGFLDRFDSLLFAIPFVWLFLKIMNL